MRRGVARKRLRAECSTANMINYYAPTVYENAIGVSREVSLQLGGGTSLTYLAASFICLFTVDRFGRRQLMMFASAGLAFCFYMTAILVAVSETRTGEQAKSLGAAGAAFVFLFQVFLGIGWLGIPFLYPTEVSTTRIRSKAAALGTFCNWMVSMSTVPDVGVLWWGPVLTRAGRVHRRHDHPYGRHQHRLARFPYLWQLQSRLHPHSVLPFPGDIQPHLGGGGQDVREGRSHRRCVQ